MTIEDGLGIVPIERKTREELSGGDAMTIRDRIIGALIWLIEHIERCKSRGLAVRLHRLADTYDPRPTGEWT